MTNLCREENLSTWWGRAKAQPRTSEEGGLGRDEAERDLLSRAAEEEEGDLIVAK